MKFTTITSIALAVCITAVADAEGPKKRKEEKRNNKEHRETSETLGTTTLNSTAYGDTKAFVDTDRDGRKFDLRQPPRKRNPEKKSPNDTK